MDVLLYGKEKSMNRNFVYVIVTAGVCLFAGLLIRSGQAANKVSPAPTRVAVVDMVKVFNDYERTKEVNKRLAKRQEEMKAKRKELIDKIEAVKAELENFQPDSKDYYERQKKLFKLSVELKSYTQVATEDIKREFRLMTEDIYKQIVDAVGDVARTTGYDLVLYLDAVKIRGDSFPALLEKIRQRKVIYSSKNIDITKSVLNYLNQKYKLENKK